MFGFFKSQERPSLIKGGSKTQREVLALLIERGRELESEFLSRREFEHPDEDEPLVQSFSMFFCCLCLSANLVGFALMGLEKDHLGSITREYAQHLSRLKAAKLPPDQIPYYAAAEMLGLPMELLRNAQYLNHFGADYNDVIEELRKD